MVILFFIKGKRKLLENKYSFDVLQSEKNSNNDTKKIIIGNNNFKPSSCELKVANKSTGIKDGLLRLIIRSVQ